jgi:3-methyladenine DNA glycosylase AlkD
MGEFIEQYPDCINELKCRTRLENRWMRQAAAVSLIVPAKQGEFLKEFIKIADLLLTDRGIGCRKDTAGC